VVASLNEQEVRLIIIFLTESHKVNFWFTFGHVAGLVNSIFFCWGCIAFARFRFPV
jgi:preprotein translocase subunit SecF